LRLSQSYDLRQEAEENRFAAIRGELSLLPCDWMNLSVDTSFDVDQGEWSSFSGEVDIRDQRENAIRVTYRNDREEDLDYGALKLDLALLKPFYISYEKRFDFAASEQLEDVLEVEYRQQCWSAMLTFRENENDRSALLTFSMKGIGQVGGVSGNIGEI
jgi:LPS-assembly protein